MYTTHLSCTHSREENIIADLASGEFQILMSGCSFWKFSNIWWNYSTDRILICLHLGSTNSFHNIHHGCQILNLKLFTTWVHLGKIQIFMLSTVWHDMANYQQNRERRREGIDNSTNVVKTDLVHTGTRTSNSNTCHYRESTPLSARYQQTTPTLPEAEIDGHTLLQEQSSTNWVSETALKIISAAWAP